MDRTSIFSKARSPLKTIMKAIIISLLCVPLCLLAMSCRQNKNNPEKDKSQEKEIENLADRINLLERRVESLMDQKMREDASKRAFKDGYDSQDIKPKNYINPHVIH